MANALVQPESGRTAPATVQALQSLISDDSDDWFTQRDLQRWAILRNSKNSPKKRICADFLQNRILNIFFAKTRARPSKHMFRELFADFGRISGVPRKSSKLLESPSKAFFRKSIIFFACSKAFLEAPRKIEARLESPRSSSKLLESFGCFHSFSIFFHISQRADCHTPKNENFGEIAQIQAPCARFVFSRGFFFRLGVTGSPLTSSALV